MHQITIYAEQDVPVAIDDVVKNLNIICENIKFEKGQTVLKITNDVIENPKSYVKLDKTIVKETKNDLLSLLFTKKPYNNNYFFDAPADLIIISLYGWEYLTTLPMNNGIVRFVVDLLALLIDDSQQHREVTGCIYDFLGDKTGIDKVLRLSGFCSECLTRISQKKLTKLQKEILSDLRRISNDLGSASKWDQDIVEYWKEEKPSADKKSNYVLKANDFLPDKDDNNYINKERKYLKELYEKYLELTSKDLPNDRRKGKIFEDFAKLFFGSIKGWKLVRQDAHLHGCEIDLIYDLSDGPNILTQRMGQNIYVECKMKNTKSPARDISQFILNAKNRHLKAGIFFSYAGITGYDPDKWTRTSDAYDIILASHKAGQFYTIPLVSADIEVVKNGKNLVEHLREALNKFSQI